MKEIVLFCLVVAFVEVNSQFFNPNMEDLFFLDSLQADLAQDVQVSKGEMVEEARVLQGKTKNFLGAKLKENVFRALRVLSEKELELSDDEQFRQEGGPEEEDGDEDEDIDVTTKTAVQTNVNATTVKYLLPKVANILKLIFGPAQPKTDFTDVIDSASKLLPKDLENQLLGVVELMVNKTDAVSTEKANARKGRQQIIINGIVIDNGTQAVTESASGFEDGDLTTPPTRAPLFKDFQTRVSESISTLIKVLPDIFTGAREAWKVFLRIEDMILDGEIDLDEDNERRK